MRITWTLPPQYEYKIADPATYFSEFNVVDSELSDAVLIHPNINKELKKEFLTQLKKKVAKLLEPWRKSSKNHE